ncbi:hypothetical protein C1Y31_06780 [Pseudomonas sp. FW305-25]|nr:hypothetical protein C1Y31_06780 [Pseudomonas sp. FW305-25]PMY73958.1 hypothetical protein C1Y32_05390 [Pseudomonas sp. FW126-L8]PNA82626.1 hypothetical protein C1Y33_03610 [Pseudomonas sp. FW305-76]
MQLRSCVNLKAVLSRQVGQFGIALNKSARMQARLLLNLLVGLNKMIIQTKPEEVAPAVILSLLCLHTGKMPSK